MSEFEEMFRHLSLELKTNDMRKFREIRDSLVPGDQLWIFHKRPLMRSYAHVVIVAKDKNFIHVSSPEVKLLMRARALICEDSQDKLDNEDLCFAVHPKEDKLPEFYRRRAEACLGILFDYDAESANCETFCNGVHGIWDDTIQVFFVIHYA